VPLLKIAPKQEAATAQRSQRVKKARDFMDENMKAKKYHRPKACT
jgi:hypothetical protein